MSTNATSTICPPPFLAVVNFPERGGATNARFCAPMPIGSGLTNTCCLPCPKQNFFYPDHFENIIHGTTYINLASVVACCFLLISFAVLPQEFTHRHYLSISLTFGILLMQISFVIPMGNQGSQCFDKITAHDMYSSMSCALSGAFLLGGGWCTVTWVFLRTLSLHLQICWQVVPGRKFFLASQAAGWSIPVIFLALALTMTGVSFRFGESCHINSKNGLQTFWGPLLAVAAGSIVTQAITFAYCIQVYLKSLMEEKGSTQATGGSSLPYSSSIRTVTARQALRRIRRVIALQWRGITVILIILADAVYFAAVFLQFDGTTEKTPENYKHGTEWVTCMILNKGDKLKCLETAKPLVVEEVKALAVLFLLSLNGLWALLLLGRPTIYKGWWKFFKNLFSRRKPVNEFVSYDARRISEPGSSTYEMLESKQRDTMSPSILKPERSLSSATRTTTIREYNPVTFSAQLRERTAESGSGIASPPFSPYQDTYAMRTPPISSPFSPFRDHPDYMSRPATAAAATSSGSPPVTPYADSPVGRDRSPKPPGAIGIAQ